LGLSFGNLKYFNYSRMATPNFGNHVTSGIIHHDTIPQLFTVAAGSYASSANYGSGAAHNLTADAAQITGSNHVMRFHDKSVHFATRIVLDLTQDFPFGNNTSDELRIGTKLTPGPTFPAIPTGKVLLQPDSHTHQPIFGDVDIIFGATGMTALTLTGEFKARLLYGGELALVRVDYTDQTVTPITTANLAGLFGEGPGTLVFSVRGDYIGQAPITTSS